MSVAGAATACAVLAAVAIHTALAQGIPQKPAIKTPAIKPRSQSLACRRSPPAGYAGKICDDHVAEDDVHRSGWGSPEIRRPPRARSRRRR